MKIYMGQPYGTFQRLKFNTEFLHKQYLLFLLWAITYVSFLQKLLLSKAHVTNYPCEI